MGFRGQGSPDSSYYDAVDAVAKEIIGGTDVELSLIHICNVIQQMCLSLNKREDFIQHRNQWHYLSI